MAGSPYYLNKAATHLADHMASSRELLARSRALCDRAGRIVEEGEFARRIASAGTCRRKA